MLKQETGGNRVLHTVPTVSRKIPESWSTLTRDLRLPRNRNRPYTCQNSFCQTSPGAVDGQHS